MIQGSFEILVNNKAAAGAAVVKPIKELLCKKKGANMALRYNSTHFYNFGLLMVIVTLSMSRTTIAAF